MVNNPFKPLQQKLTSLCTNTAKYANLTHRSDRKCYRGRLALILEELWMFKRLLLVVAIGSLFSVQTRADDKNLGITLADGYHATIFADNLGRARHLTVRSNGDVYVAMRGDQGIMALRDTNGDGQADLVEEFASEAETEVDIHNGYLYFSSNTAVFRVKLNDNVLLPQGEIETVISGFVKQRQHASKTFTFDGEGNIYVNVGAPSNACQVKPRSTGSPGQDPCPQLEQQAGIWRFDANKIGQTQVNDGHRFATGLRNGMAIDWSDESGLHVLQHGRDQLGTLWPDYFSTDDNAELPAEEFHQITDGSNLGWPFTYFDPSKKKRMQGPEYGGDGKIEATDRFQSPILTFPAHWAPNDLVFYKSGAFSPTMKGGAFIAFHGSWNRAPKPQQGYRVVFVPFKVGEINGLPVDIATGFSGDEELADSRKAVYRPVGIAEGPDGSLYVSDSMKGRIWKIMRNEQSFD